jgi:membrane-bound metal-dependent hydrolase YbcI (DUF457 family)
MDIFAHALWTNIVYFKKYKAEVRNRFIAVVFGVVPDLMSFVPFFVYTFLGGKEFWQVMGSGAWVARYASESYNYTHSIVIFSLVFIVVGLFRKFWNRSFVYWPIFGWLLHILIDIPSHKDFYETPFLFPLSGYKFSHGVSWGHPIFMITNYGALAAIYLVWFLVFRKKNLPVK